MARPNKKPIPSFTSDLKPATSQAETNEEDFNDLVDESGESEPTTSDESSAESADRGGVENDSYLDSERGVEGEAAQETGEGVLDETPITPRDCGYSAIDTAPKVGIQIIISATGTDEGVRAFWKRSRFFKQGRWQMTGKWIEPVTGRDIEFEPRYWKEVQ